ncbi:hypothetical protein NC652_000741 [Populus alba x Populus x berolinensis]|nr:hypothetical protein NC652_000741 [Populus alba x Populus x berolinensis]
MLLLLINNNSNKSLVMTSMSIKLLLGFRSSNLGLWPFHEMKTS